jgi:hypothetical protein
MNNPAQPLVGFHGVLWYSCRPGVANESTLPLCETEVSRYITLVRDPGSNLRAPTPLVRKDTFGQIRSLPFFICRKVLALFVIQL